MNRRQGRQWGQVKGVGVVGLQPSPSSVQPPAIVWVCRVHPPSSRLYLCPLSFLPTTRACTFVCSPNFLSFFYHSFFLLFIHSRIPSLSRLFSLCRGISDSNIDCASDPHQEVGRGGEGKGRRNLQLHQWDQHSIAMYCSHEYRMDRKREKNSSPNMCLCMRVRVCVQSSCVYQFREEERITGMTGGDKTVLQLWMRTVWASGPSGRQVARKL